MTKMSGPFKFYTHFHLVRLLGIRARNPVELLEGLKKVPTSSIYYHTHRFLEKHHYLSPEPPNDFAYWLSNILNQKDLGELFASVDIANFRDMEDVRSEFIKILEEYISKGRRIVNCPEGQEFHFSSCITIILPTPYVASDLREFVEVLGKISIYSIYFHMFEATMRLRRGASDFATWFRGMGEEKLAEEISELSIYTITLNGLRKKLIKLVSKYAKN